MHSPAFEEHDENLSQRLAQGDRDALSLLLSRNRDRLKRMVMLRMSPALLKRMDGSDVIQEAFLQASVHAETYQHDEERPFYLWIRKIVENKLLEMQRHHLRAKRDMQREVGQPTGRAQVSADSLAGFLIESSGSGPLSKVMRLELRAAVQEAIEAMDPVDREVLVLRHFEQLSLSEIADVLGISKSGAAKRHRVAVKRIHNVMESAEQL